MRNRSRAACTSALALALCAWVSALLPRAAHAVPCAKLTAVSLQVYHKAGPDGQVQWSKVGDWLPPGSRVCTMKRSGCEIKFPDGSKIRMGARSDLIINDVTHKNVQVCTGEVFAQIVSGTGAQIQGATATASIKGTWVLWEAPTAPGVEPVRVGDTCSVWNGEVEFSSAQGTTPIGDGKTSSAMPGGAPSAVTSGYSYAFGGGNLYPAFAATTPGASTLATPGGSAGLELKDTLTTSRATLAPLVQAPTTGTIIVNLQSVRPASVGLAPTGALSSVLGSLSVPALGQVGVEEKQAELFGRKLFGPRSELDVIGILYDGGSLGGVWPRASAIAGHCYAEIGAQSFTDFEGSWNTRVSDAFVLDRLGNTDVTVGRQRYLEGPVNNGGLGSLFGAIHFDGLSVKHKDEHYTAKLSWLGQFDAFDRDPVTTHGWLGRVSTPLWGGQLAFNALQQQHDGWGFSGDLALPAIPRQLDVYTELGCDPMGRHLETFGAYFPGLYQKADIDLFVERAKRGDGPATWSAEAYADLNKGWTGLAGVRKEQGSDWQLLAGFVKSLGSLDH